MVSSSGLRFEICICYVPKAVEVFSDPLCFIWGLMWSGEMRLFIDVAALRMSFCVSKDEDLGEGSQEKEEDDRDGSCGWILGDDCSLGSKRWLFVSSTVSSFSLWDV